MRKIFCKQQKKLNKKGFTIVELLVSIAIMAVISLLLGQLVAATSGAYKRISATTEIQQSAQEALTQISNIVRNSNKLVISKGDGIIVMESMNYANEKIVLVYVAAGSTDEGDMGKIYVDFNHAETISTVSREEDASVPELDITQIQKEDFLITDLVKDFTVDYSTYLKSVGESEDVTAVEVTQNRTLDLSLTLEKNGRESTQNYKASLRNSNVAGNNEDLIIKIENIVGGSIGGGNTTSEDSSEQNG